MVIVNKFSNFRVGTKILIGYVFALALMAMVVGVAILRINQINATVTNLAQNLAAEQHLADQIVANVWSIHFYALQYMDQQNPEDLKRYRAEFANFEQILAVANQQITDERMDYLDNIRTGIQTYSADVTRVINLLTWRKRDLLVNLDQQGRLTEIKLEQLRANSFFADDTVTSYYAGNAQRALLLMRVAAFQYLGSGDLYWIDEFNRAYENAQNSFHKLDKATLSPVYRELVHDAETAVNTYVQSFAKVQENYAQQEALVANKLNVVGPEIRTVGSAMSASVGADFQAAADTTQALVAQTEWVLLVTMGLAIVTALSFGGIIASSITRPLQQVTNVSRQIADLDLRTLTTEMDAIAHGDLTRNLTITAQALSFESGDEIGQMARAFNAIITQLQKTGQSFSDMAVNLANLTRRNALLFEQMQHAKEAAEAASRAKSEFLSNMSHELRTPLTAILSYAQILKLNGEQKPSPEEGLAIIQQSGEHLLTLINDILDMAKIEAGRLELRPHPIHLPTFLDGVVRMMRMRAEQKGIGFVYTTPTALPPGLEVDAKRLRQVLINLLSNAVKFTDQGQVTLKISVINDPESTNPAANQPHRAESVKTIRFEVADTGVGIRPEQLEKIFEPFEQAGDRARRAEGTGLGLTISRQIVQAMRGNLQVESRAGQGSTFWFEVACPIVEVDLELTTNEVVKESALNGASQGKGNWLDKEPLIPPPPAEMAVLLDLAMKGNMPGIRKRAAQLEQMDQQYRPFAAKLQQLARLYAEDEILALVNQGMEHRLDSE